jgi:Arc/MetJ-type ribon-helix-helix transcriptional regulator
MAVFSGGMRTTVTIDDDVARKLQRLVARREGRFKTVLNDVLRAGLESVDAPRRQRDYQTSTRALRFLPGVDPFKLGQVGDELADIDKVRRSG